MHDINRRRGLSFDDIALEYIALAPSLSFITYLRGGT